MKELWFKRVLALALSLVMCLTLIPAGAASAEDGLLQEVVDEDLIALIEDSDNDIVIVDETAAGQPREEQTGDAASEEGLPLSGQQTVINPLYRDYVTEQETSEFEARVEEARGRYTPQADGVEYFSSFTSAGSYMKKQMVSREGTIIFMIPASVVNEHDCVYQDLLEEAVKHTESCSGKEGDALRWVWARYNVSWSYRTNDDGLGCYQFNYTLEYYTTAAQEKTLTSEVNSAMKSLSLSGKTERNKILAIHDYICDRVNYDYDHVSDSSYKLQFTAYAAMHYKTAVCQGYAVLFYRMCKEAGLGVRVVTSSNHAWNIVRIGNVYYNIDTTWDGQDDATLHDWYLKGMRDFPRHPREYPYNTEEFECEYPMVADPKLNVSNLNYSFTTVGGSTVSTKASGKAKLLVFGNFMGCGNCRSMVTGLGDYKFTDIDVYAIDTEQASKADLKKFAADNGCGAVVFCYDPDTTASSAMWNYLRQAGNTDYSIYYPVVIYIDANDMIQDYSTGYVAPATIIRRMGTYLDVNPGYAAPRITSQPSSVTAKASESVSFSVGAVGQGTINYQWQYRKSSSSSWNNCSSTGNKTTSLTVEATTARNGFQYRCRVKSPYGTTYSKTVKLTVVTKPTITTQPSNKTISINTSTKFTVKASGGGLSYQWYYRKNSDDSWKTTSLTGAKTATLTVKGETVRNGYQYRCRVKNAAGTVYSKAAKLTVATKAVITTQPKSTAVLPNATATFTVKAVGPSLTYQWQYRTGSSGSWKNSSASGNQTAKLSVTGKSSNNGYQYRCVIKNSYGTVYSSAATLVVSEDAGSKPTITTQPKSISVSNGSNAIFTVKASGAATYQWYYRSSSSSSWYKSTSTGYNTAKLTVEATAKRNGFQYRCAVSNSIGTTYTNTVTLTVTN